MTGKKRIIIISGKQLSGKDTVANVLSKSLPGFKLAPIGDAIKIEFGQEKNLTFTEVDRNKPLYRAELIQFGNKKRMQDRDYWIKKVLFQNGDLIISDVRLKYELETFHNLGAVTIRVNSDREERAKRGHIVEEHDLTETELDNVTDWDYIIENNEDSEALKKKAKKLAQSIEKSLNSCSK